jgi:hypothetical protein
MTTGLQLFLVLLMTTFLMMGASLTGIGMGGGIVLSIVATIGFLIVTRKP